jgi:hypothetical protein
MGSLAFFGLKKSVCLGCVELSPVTSTPCGRLFPDVVSPKFLRLLSIIRLLLLNEYRGHVAAGIVSALALVNGISQEQYALRWVRTVLRSLPLHGVSRRFVCHAWFGKAVLSVLG